MIQIATPVADTDDKSLRRAEPRGRTPRILVYMISMYSMIHNFMYSMIG